MLSIEDNETITRTGPGTPMGDLFRRFWIPALLSSELPGPDCTPVRVRLLSERLIAFRDTEGKIGLLEERCPHRHASLYWGRNEDCGLRCIYHGWKYTTDGSCVDQPAEPEDSRFKDHIHAVAYETHEAGGIVWTYMGPKDKKPPFPHFEWTLLPEDHYLASKRLQMCNYLQNLEGELDTAHVNFLHRNNIGPDEPVLPPSHVARKRFFIAETDFGMLSMGRGDFPGGISYWRITPYHLPAYTLIPWPADWSNTFTAAIPIDDTHMWGYTVNWHHDRPLNDDEIQGVMSGMGSQPRVDPVTFRPLQNMDNDYLIDREAQRTRSFTGIPGVRVEDMVVQEDQDGPICFRHEEHLGTTDRAIVGARRLLLRLAADLRNGIEPPQAQHPESFRLRSVAEEVSNTKDPIELWHEMQPVPVGTTKVEAAY